MNLYMTALSNIHTPLTTPTSSSPKRPRQADRWTARAGAEWFWRGWGVILIQCLLYLDREGANGTFLTRLTLDESHHTFSQGTCVFFFFFFLPSPLFFFLSAMHSFFHFYSVKGKKRKNEKKNKVDKGCPPSSQQREEEGTDSSLEDRPESRDIPQCS